VLHAYQLTCHSSGRSHYYTVCSGRLVVFLSQPGKRVANRGLWPVLTHFYSWAGNYYVTCVQ